jgi:hypothetical protein
MKPKSIAGTGLLLASLAEGVLYPAAARVGEGALVTLQFASVVVCFAMVFIWLRYDELQFGYRRSALFNAGIIVLALVFIPLYFSRSRPPGSRLMPALASVGMMAFSYGLTLAGYYLVRTVI